MTDEDFDISEDMEREFSPQRKDTTMADTFSTAKQAQNYDPRYDKATASRVSPFDELTRAVDDLRSCDTEFGNLADRLAGPQPQEVASQNPSGGGGGLIDVVERAILSIRAITSNLSEHHSRINRRI